MRGQGRADGLRAVPGTSSPRAGGRLLALGGCGEGGPTGEAGGEWFPLHTIFKHKGVFLKLKSGCVFLTRPHPLVNHANDFVTLGIKMGP